MYENWQLILWSLRRPDARSYHGTRLPPGERCPLIGRGCANGCEYDRPHEARTRVAPYKLRDGTVVSEHRTATGLVDGRCLRKRAALVQAAGFEPA